MKWICMKKIKERTKSYDYKKLETVKYVQVFNFTTEKSLAANKSSNSKAESTITFSRKPTHTHR